jgi:hypothetical protein
MRERTPTAIAAAAIPPVGVPIGRFGAFGWPGWVMMAAGPKTSVLSHCAAGVNITDGHINVLSYCVAAGLCREGQDEEVAAEQLAQEIRALQDRALKAEGEVAAIQARESARLDDRLVEIRRRHPLLSLEQCARQLEFEESIS